MASKQVDPRARGRSGGPSTPPVHAPRGSGSPLVPTDLSPRWPRCSGGQCSQCAWGAQGWCCHRRAELERGQGEQPAVGTLSQLQRHLGPPHSPGCAQPPLRSEGDIWGWVGTWGTGTRVEQDGEHLRVGRCLREAGQRESLRLGGIHRASMSWGGGSTGLGQAMGLGDTQGRIPGAGGDARD